MLVAEKNVEVLQVFEGDLAPLLTDEIEQGLDLINIKKPYPRLKYSNKAVIRDWASVILPVLTERFKDLILSINHGGIQSFPIIAEREDGKESCTLHVVNFLQRLDAIDLSESMIMGNEGEIGYSIWTPSIIESRTNNLDIFRLNGTSWSIYITEKLAKLIRKNKITGVQLLQVKTSSK